MTDFIREVIVILEDELKEGYLTDREFDDYVNLFRCAAEKIFQNHSNLRKEADLMTKPLIELPSVLQKRLRTENDALIADLAERDAVIADKNAELADKSAKLADKNAELADKNAELARMRELLTQYHIPVPS